VAVLGRCPSLMLTVSFFFLFSSLLLVPLGRGRTKSDVDKNAMKDYVPDLTVYLLNPEP
jgi:hypothetical protein